MPNDTPNATPAAEPKKEPLTTTQYLKADGTEADSPLDSARALRFRLNAAGKDWTLDMAQVAEGAIAYGVDAATVNFLAAMAGFGYKTKLNNIANSVRNGKQKGTDEAGPAAQAAAVDEFLADCLNGNWRGEAGEGIIAGNADLAEAIHRWQKSAGKTPTPVEELKTKLDAMSKEQRAERRNHAGVAAELAKLRAERAVAKAGSATTNDDLLNM